MKPISWSVSVEDTATGEVTIIAVTKDGNEANRIAKNAGVGEGYKVLVNLY